MKNAVMLKDNKLLIDYLKLLKNDMNQNSAKYNLSGKVISSKKYLGYPKISFYHNFNKKITNRLIIVNKYKFFLSIEFTFPAKEYSLSSPLIDFLGYQINNLTLRISCTDTINVLFTIIKLLKNQNIKKLTLSLYFPNFLTSPYFSDLALSDLAQRCYKIAINLRTCLNKYSFDKEALIFYSSVITNVAFKDALWKGSNYNKYQSVTVNKTCGIHHRNNKIISRVKTDTLK